SVVANFIPREIVELTHAALAGDWKLAREQHLKLYPLSRAMFMETKPIPVKEAMAMIGLIEPGFRLTMCRQADANHTRLMALLDTVVLSARGTRIRHGVRRCGRRRRPHGQPSRRAAPGRGWAPAGSRDRGPGARGARQGCGRGRRDRAPRTADHRRP